MPTFFALKTFDGKHRSFDQADRMAVSMYKRIRNLNARVLAVRNLGADGFVFAVPGKNVLAGAVVSKLRSDPSLTQFQISDEVATIEGPFEWKKKATPGMEWPLKLLTLADWESDGARIVVVECFTSTTPRALLP